MTEPIIKPVAPQLKAKVLKAYTRQGFQFGNTFIRPDLNKVVTPVGKEQEAFCAELIKQGTLYVVEE